MISDLEEQARSLCGKKIQNIILFDDNNKRAFLSGKLLLSIRRNFVSKSVYLQTEGGCLFLELLNAKIETKTHWASYLSRGSKLFDISNFKIESVIVSGQFSAVSTVVLKLILSSPHWEHLEPPSVEFFLDAKGQNLNINSKIIEPTGATLESEHSVSVFGDFVKENSFKIKDMVDTIKGLTSLESIESEINKALTEKSEHIDDLCALRSVFVNIEMLYSAMKRVSDFEAEEEDG